MGVRDVLPLFTASRGGAARMGRGKALAGRPGVAVAMRVPERTSAQLALVFPTASPQLFVHEGARQSLERRLAAAFPGPVVLSITDNQRSIVAHTCKDGVLRARIHHMFLDAPANVVDALVRYVTGGDRDATVLIGRYIEANADRLAHRSRKLGLTTKGKHHDLLSIFADVNERYFGGSVDAVVTWGNLPATRGPRKSIKLGSYSAAERLIRVHPAIDREWVPRYFVAYIVYHEMLHHVIPASRSSGRGRSLVHPPEFTVRERDFRRYDRAIAWERAHIARLLRA